MKAGTQVFLIIRFPMFHPNDRDSPHIGQATLKKKEELKVDVEETAIITLRLLMGEMEVVVGYVFPSPYLRNFAY